MDKKPKSSVRSRNLDRKLVTSILYILDRNNVTLEEIQQRLLLTFGCLIEIEQIDGIINFLRKKKLVTLVNIRLSLSGIRRKNKLNRVVIPTRRRTELVKIRFSAETMRFLLRKMKAMYTDSHGTFLGRFQKTLTVNKKQMRRNLILAIRGLLDEYKKRRYKDQS